MTITTLQGLTDEETFRWFGSITRSSLESISLRSLGTIFSAIPHAHVAPLSASGLALTETPVTVLLSGKLVEHWSDHKLCVACQTGIHSNHCRQQR